MPTGGSSTANECSASAWRPKRACASTISKGLLVDYRFDEVRPGSHDPVAHLLENESDGVWGSVLYPSVATMLYNLADSAALDALAGIYNDWIADWCATSPPRLKGVGILNVDDPMAAARELERIRDRGLAGALVPVSPADDAPYDDPRYEPLWAAAEALQMPLSLHIATNRTPDAPPLAAMTLDDEIAMVHNSDKIWTYYGVAGHISANPALCIPDLVLNDAGQGVGDQEINTTAFPAPIAQAASWDRNSSSSSVDSSWGTRRGRRASTSSSRPGSTSRACR